MISLNCPICLDEAKDPIVTNCGHRYCKECLKKCVERISRDCPFCRTYIEKATYDTEFERIKSKIYLMMNKFFFISK